MESDFELFGRTAKEGMGDPQWAAYLGWHEEACANAPRPGTIVYLRADLETCMKRIAVRGRAGEASIDAAYLARLHDAHEAWIAKLQRDGERRVVVLDANADGDEAVDRLAEAVAAALGVTTAV